MLGVLSASTNDGHYSNLEELFAACQKSGQSKVKVGDTHIDSNLCRTQVYLLCFNLTHHFSTFRHFLQNH